MKRAVIAAICALAALAGSCGLDRPGDPDGSIVLILEAIDTSGSSGVARAPVPGASVEVSSSSQVYQRTFTTDDSGRVAIEGLAAGNYYVRATKRADVQYGLLVGQKQMNIRYEAELRDSLLLSFVKLSPVVLNEVYFCGCNGSIFYYYDQFVELYNSTADTIYLDGHIVCRSTQVDYIMDWETVDFALGYYVYRFPGVRGVTRECPIAPYDYLVIASDAVNHNLYGSLCINLLEADWEFFNALANDYDNRAVPDLTPISMLGTDFSYNIGHCALWLATGEEYRHAEHCYTSTSGGLVCSQYVEVPLYTILDAVEYSANPDSPRYITKRLDGALGGNGIVKYSGISMERKTPGLDSDNSAFDFEPTRPTPGYSHAR